MMNMSLFLPGKQTVNSLHLPFMWMKQKKRLKRGRLHLKKQHENVLAFNSAITLPGPRKPLVPLDYPMDGSFESPHTMDISIVLEDEKPLSVNEVPDYHEDIHTHLR